MNRRAIFHRHRGWIVLATLSVLLFMTLAVGLSVNNSPWHDEAHLASPALNLATRGFMGTTVLESHDGWLDGIERHTYWVLPLYLVTLAGWFKAFGASLIAMRLFSMFWGLVALASWFSIVRRLTGDVRIGLCAVSLLAVDYVFIMTASSGRMDMMCTALGSAGIATYLCWRETRLTPAILLSQTLVAMCGMTHPNGIVWFAGLLLVTLWLDFRKLKSRQILAAVAPYLIGSLMWAAYIGQDTAAFRSQFLNNVDGLGGVLGNLDRQAGLKNPLLGFKNEIMQRYLGGFAWYSKGAAQLKVLVLLAYVSGVFGSLLIGDIRRARGTHLFLSLTGLFFVIFALYEGHKNHLYLINMIPLFATLLAMCVLWLWRRGGTYQRIPLALTVLALVALQVGGISYFIRRSYYESKFASVARFLRQHVEDDQTVVGSAEFAFEVGFDRVKDDVWLGFYDSQKPDYRQPSYIVLDYRYEQALKQFEDKQPEVALRARRILEDDYREIFDDRTGWKIYALR